MFGLSRTASFSIIVCLITMSVRMFAMYGDKLKNPTNEDDAPLTQIPALIRIHCSKHFEILGYPFFIPFDRDVNCSSTHWRGRRLRNTLCLALAGLEKEKEEMKMNKVVADVDIFDQDDKPHWRKERKTLIKICTSVKEHYVLLKTGFFELGRINGTWRKDSFDFDCPL